MDLQTADKMRSLTALWSKWMKLFGVVAAFSTIVFEIDQRKLLGKAQLSESVAGLMSYLSFASASMFLMGAVLGAMFWARGRSRR